MATRFNVQNEPFPNLYWVTCSWNVSAALFPLVFVPLTENTGRMPDYFVGHLTTFLQLFIYIDRPHTSSLNYSL